MTRPSDTRRTGLRGRAKTAVFRVLQAALYRYARARPRDGVDPPPDGKVYILLVSAWGMGGTIRAALNLAGHLAQHREVEIISAFRRREESFFGSFPPGIKVSALDDQRPGREPRGLARHVRRILKGRSSLLMHPVDRAAPHFNPWVDFQLVRRLRGKTGYLIATRPGLNLVVADLQLPGFVTVGQEQMHLMHHNPILRAAMPRRYGGLDALVVLTELDVERYSKLLNGQVPLVRIPNTVREMGGPKADLEAKTVLAAGRLTGQKGFDMLIEAYAQVAPDHPDWRLRICGRGDLRDKLQGMIDERGLSDVVELPGPSSALGDDMARASTFVLSSRFEGFPLVLLEAMSKALAIVAFDCPTGPRDIVDDHRNGILVPAMDVDRLATGIREMIENPELRRRCGPAAAETAHSYTMDVIGPRWDALLEELRTARAAG